MTSPRSYRLKPYASTSLPRVPPLTSIATGLRHFTSSILVWPLRSVTCVVDAFGLNKVEILRLGAAPTVAQVPDQRIGVPQRAIRDQIFEGALIGAAGIGPDMDIANADAVGRRNHPRAGLQAAKEHCVRMNRHRRYAERHGRPTGIAANRKGDRDANLALK